MQSVSPRPRRRPARPRPPVGPSPGPGPSPARSRLGAGRTPEKARAREGEVRGPRREPAPPNPSPPARSREPPGGEAPRERAGSARATYPSAKALEVPRPGTEMECVREGLVSGGAVATGEGDGGSGRSRRRRGTFRAPLGGSAVPEAARPRRALATRGDTSLHHFRTTVVIDLSANLNGVNITTNSKIPVGTRRWMNGEARLRITRRHKQTFETQVLHKTLCPLTVTGVGADHSVKQDSSFV
jgi:hypothetical protein